MRLSERELRPQSGAVTNGIAECIPSKLLIRQEISRPRRRVLTLPPTDNYSPLMTPLCLICSESGNNDSACTVSFSQLLVVVPIANQSKNAKTIPSQHRSSNLFEVIERSRIAANNRQ